jgi:hypothetical protein
VPGEAWLQNTLLVSCTTLFRVWDTVYKEFSHLFHPQTTGQELNAMQTKYLRTIDKPFAKSVKLNLNRTLVQAKPGL